MAYTTTEQELYDFARSSIPRFLFSEVEAAEEWIGGFVKEFDAVRTNLDFWIRMAQILEATGIWLEQHARDRGTTRRLNETDAALRVRLRNVEDAVTVAALIATATAILLADGVTIPPGYPAIVETRRDGAFMGTWSATPPTPPGAGYANRKMTYLSRGYRMRGLRGSIIIILPYGTSEETALSVFEAARLKKAAGFKLVVERRLNP